MTELLKETLEVKHKGETYEFRIPGMADEIRLGMHERAIRRELSPDRDSSVSGLDPTTFLLVRACAVFEVLLKSATTEWPFTPDEKGAPKVDFRKFPKDKVEEVAAVGLKFDDELARFRQGGTPDGQPAGEEAVAGQPDS